MPENKLIHPRRVVRLVRSRRDPGPQPQAATPAPRAAAADPAKPLQARAGGALQDKPGGAQPAAEPVQRRGEVQNRIVGVVGRKGSGKSTKLRQLLRYCPRWVAFDPMRDHAALAAGNVFESIPGLARFLRWSREQPTFAGVYVPQGDPAEEIEEASRLVYARGGLCLISEEVPLYTQAGYIPPLFGRLIRTGRHRRIDIAWTAQRAAEVPKTLTSLTDIWLLFSQTEPKDLAALAERCGREVADKVASLGAHEFLLWDAVTRTYLADSPRLLRQDTAQRETEES